MSRDQSAIYSSAAVRAIDRYAIDRLGIPGYTLMTRAGEAAFELLRQSWPAARRIVVICGTGNNAGDGYVVARLALEQQFDVQVIALSDAAKLQGDAQRAHQDFQRGGGLTRNWDAAHLQQADLIVDAIFGTGLTRALDASLIEHVNAINAAGKPILALDIPSGLSADTGEALGASVRAAKTITFVGRKLGCYLGEGPDYVGQVAFAGLNIPPVPVDVAQPAATVLDRAIVAEALPRRARTSHKGSNGHVLIIGGGASMGGAARLAGEASLRVGAGLVTVATHPQNVAAIVSARPELICRGIEHGAELAPLIEKASVVAVGPGLGGDLWAQSLFDAAVGCDRPLVADADALNLLAKKPRQRGRWILTPHPGEAGRLLDLSTADIQRQRLKCAADLAARFDAVAVLKGAGTIVARAGELPAICPFGNPGMATPGMGDVLTGIIAGLLAQIRDVEVAARVGVIVHALAGDLAARGGERGLIASDLFAYLPECVNP
jgi:ADP-dependent NAD(P)H-hydrate dehydratase / NAD(P)H-hydrate epimerase